MKCGVKCGASTSLSHNPQQLQSVVRFRGGEGGIRTPDRLAPMPHFECGAFDHSATSPGAMTGRFGPRSGRVLGEEGGADKARGGEIRAKTSPMAFGKRGGTARRDKN